MWNSERLDRGPHVLAERDRGRRIAIRDHRGELFAAVARQQRARRVEAGLERVRDLLQTRVAGDVSVAVVERLEEVDVD
jgi:hypothetical protein